MYDHIASTERLNEIMREDYNASRMPGEKTIPRKVDIVDALKDIQRKYAQIGRKTPSFSDGMALIASQHSA